MLGEKKQRNSKLDWDVILTNGNGTSTGLLMLFDGYNEISLDERFVSERFERLALLLGMEDQRVLGDRLGSVKKVPTFEWVFKQEDNGRQARIAFSGVGASIDSNIEKRYLDDKEVTEGKLRGSLILASNDVMIWMVGTGDWSW
ncbi:hypothetical protein ACHAWX_006607 [Stephanocyclus meneghinianus]